MDTIKRTASGGRIWGPFDAPSVDDLRVGDILQLRMDPDLLIALRQENIAFPHYWADTHIACAMADVARLHMERYPQHDYSQASEGIYRRESDG